MRVAMLKASQMNQLDEFLSVGFALGSWHASHFRTKDDIFQNRAPGKQSEFLKHHPGLLLTVYGPADVDRAAPGFLQSRNDLEEGGFATARRSNENQELALLDIHTDAAKRHHLFFGALDVPDLADILEAQNGCHHSCLNLPWPLFFKEGNFSSACEFSL